MIKILQEFLESHVTQTAHVDEIVDYSVLITKKQLWEHSLELFNNIVADVKSLELKSVRVDLHFELISDKKFLSGIPRNEQYLIDSIDILTMPEIIISTPKRDFWIPRTELYTCPISFEIEGLEEDIFILYEEYRTIEEKYEGLEFTRWLTISYLDRTTTAMVTPSL